MAQGLLEPSYKELLLHRGLATFVAVGGLFYFAVVLYICFGPVQLRRVWEDATLSGMRTCNEVRGMVLLLRCD